MREVFLIRYKNSNQIEAFEDFDDAMNAGVDYISQMGAELNWTEDEINDEVCSFIDYNDVDLVEFYPCEVKEARQ